MFGVYVRHFILVGVANVMIWVLGCWLKGDDAGSGVERHLLFVFVGGWSSVLAPWSGRGRFCWSGAGRPNAALGWTM